MTDEFKILIGEECGTLSVYLQNENWQHHQSPIFLLQKHKRFKIISFQVKSQVILKNKNKTWKFCVYLYSCSVYFQASDFAYSWFLSVMQLSANGVHLAFFFSFLVVHVWIN